MPERPDNARRRIELSGVQVAASALAAVSSAFLLSELGAAGTVIGAAIASVVATVGSAVYVHLFRRTGEQLRDVRAAKGTEREPSRTRTWLVRSAVAAVAVFVLAMGAITLVEAGMGRSFASLFGNGGGSTIGTITDGGHKPKPETTTNDTDTSEQSNTRQENGSTPTPGATTPSPGASKDAPSAGSTGTPTPSGSATTPSTGTPAPTSPDTGSPTPTPSTPSSGAATSQQSAGTPSLAQNTP